MAIDFKQLNDKLELSPLSDKELAAINRLEEFIDAEILERYKGNEIRLNLYQVQFKRGTNNSATDWADARRKLMYDEIKSRYNKAGWECSEEIADSTDRFSQDYFVLDGKKSLKNN